jgi:hypothetical protein
LIIKHGLPEPVKEDINGAVHDSVINDVCVPLFGGGVPMATIAPDILHTKFPAWQAGAPTAMFKFPPLVTTHPCPGTLLAIMVQL